jgi:proline iminopeptidase
MRVSIGDVSLYFDVSGPGWEFDEDEMRERPVLIGLHGGPGLDGTKLRYQFAPLADTVQVIVPDQRGHGRSDLSDAEHWTLATWAADVKALSDALGIQHPVVFGSSFGGFVAQQYASDYPDHPAGMILASTAARVTSLDELVARFREVGGDEVADVVRRDGEQPTEETFAEFKRVCMPFLSLSPNPDPGVITAEAARIETMTVNLHFMQGEANELTLLATDNNVRRPTLILVGEHDPLIPIALAEEIVTAIPNGLARLHVVPDAAHDLLTDNPDFTTACIREFIRDVT